MELREFAEQVLYSRSLDEKLLLNPKVITDEAPEAGSFIMPDGPGRPSELQVSARGVKADFPGTNRLDDDVERGKMLHFLANHELLATELMALVLLKFPNAPKEFRLGVYETLKEEQAHTLMYMRRMRDCGVEFGELPVNDYFWRAVAPMEQPMDFVSRLSLVFEQANLDYSVHYAKLFRQVGDGGTAAVLEKIYEDEIEHVGHGLKWFRRWKDQSKSDWEAFKTQLFFPLSPVRAKGVAPFNAEGRKIAGIDSEWIEALEIEEQSRGRTPVLHWFNPNAEGEELAKINNKPFSPKRNVRLLEEDLDMLPIAWTRRDDVLLLRNAPSRQHLVNLRAWGFPMPECIELGGEHDLEERRIGGMRPWAWQQRACDVLAPYAQNMSEQVAQKWRNHGESEWMSKKLGFRLEQLLGEPVGQWCESEAEVMEYFSQSDGNILMKAAYSNAGRGHCRIIDGDWSQSAKGWLKRSLSEHGGLLVEPWLNRVVDFSSQYERAADGSIKHIGMTQVLNDSLGRFRGCLVLPKWAQGYDAELSTFLFRDSDAHAFYRHRLPEALNQLLGNSDYVGAIGIDSMVFRHPDGTLAFRPVVEVNMRHTMGRVAVELLKKSAPGMGGLYEIVRKSQTQGASDEHSPYGPEAEGGEQVGLSAGLYPLNDPSQAEEFIAQFRVARPSVLLGCLDK
ncbi:DUF455 family protein [Rubritalea marina]|uniref:DUF455 family protein n=1 Tax=Rubritalea marina TaxID=361055 RepID=UPI00037266CD|nr:DUF455 family protein [Rubritalea marina]